MAGWINMPADGDTDWSASDFLNQFRDAYNERHFIRNPDTPQTLNPITAGADVQDKAWIVSMQNLLEAQCQNGDWTATKDSDGSAIDRAAMQSDGIREWSWEDVTNSTRVNIKKALVAAGSLDNSDLGAGGGWKRKYPRLVSSTAAQSDQDNDTAEEGQFAIMTGTCWDVSSNAVKGDWMGFSKYPPILPLDDSWDNTMWGVLSDARGVWAGKDGQHATWDKDVGDSGGWTFGLDNLHYKVKLYQSPILRSPLNYQFQNWIYFARDPSGSDWRPVYPNLYVFSDSNWRPVPSGYKVGVSDPAADTKSDYGVMATGDYIGPWIWNEWQAVLNELRWRTGVFSWARSDQGYPTYSNSGSGSVVTDDYANSDLAAAAAQVLAQSDWKTGNNRSVQTGTPDEPRSYATRTVGVLNTSANLATREGYPRIAATSSDFSKGIEAWMGLVKASVPGTADVYEFDCPITGPEDGWGRPYETVVAKGSKTAFGNKIEDAGTGTTWMTWPATKGYGLYIARGWSTGNTHAVSKYDEGADPLTHRP